MSGTPLTVIAGKTLLDNSGIDINSDLILTLSQYTQLQIVRDHVTMIDVINARSGNENPIPSSTITKLDNLFKQKMPFLSNAAPPGITTRFMTDYILNQAKNQLGMEDGQPLNNGFFLSLITATTGYIGPINDTIKSAVEGSKLAGSTFTTMDALSSGNILAIANPAITFGEDLINTGTLYDFKRMDIFNTPHAILVRLDDLGFLGLVEPQLEAAGLESCDLPDFSDEDATMDEPTQKLAYNAFTKIVGNELQELLDVFEIVTPNITQFSDLFDIFKMFPTSKNSLNSLDAGSPDKIFTGNANSGWVNSLTTTMTAVMPAAIATAGVAMNIAFQQVADLKETTALKMGTAAINIESNAGLAAVEEQTSPIPAEIVSYYIETMGKGSAENGTFVLTDGVGTAAGIPHVFNFQKIISTISTIESQFTALLANNTTGIFYMIKQVANGAYDSGIIVYDFFDEFDEGTRALDVTLPAGAQASNETSSKYYASRSAAITALYNLAVTQVNNIASSNVTLISQTSKLYSESGDQIERELLILKEAFIQFLQTYNPPYDRDPDDAPSVSTVAATLGFAKGLTGAGDDNEPGGLNDIMQKMVTADGQAIIAALREGRNKKKLTESGVKSGSDIKT